MDSTAPSPPAHRAVACEGAALSVVVPVYNEALSIGELDAEIRAAVAKLSLPAEIIYVDDGSRDGSFDVLRRIRTDDAHVRIVRFRRNFGQTAAVACGLERTTGEIVVTLDSDRQNDPKDIAKIVAKL